MTQALLIGTITLYSKSHCPVFTKKSKAVKIHSNFLNEDLWLLSDDKMCSKIKDDLVVYFPEEIGHLSKIKAGLEHIRKIHAAKKIFPGSRIVWN